MSDTEIDILITGRNEARAALRGATGDVDDLDAAGGRATRPGGGLGGMVGMLGGPAVAAAGLAGTAILGVGTAAFSMAADFDQAQRQLQSSLGLTEEQAASMRPMIEELFTSGMVNSATEAADAIGQARLQLQGMADEELTGAATKALQLSQVYGEDYSKVLNSVNTLQQQFGLSADEAFNFVAGGFQKGLNGSGDFLDSIGEYSTQFANGGADAGQFFSVMESGLQGGMLGTDKAADLFKEFRLRIQDGSDATVAGLGQIGLSWEEINAGLADGSLTAADAFTIVQQAIANTEDPTVRMQAGAALMGSQFEDLGDSAVAGISLAQTSLDDLAGSTDSVGAQFGGLGADFESAKREIMTALLPLGEELVTLAKEYMPEIKEGARVLAIWLGENLPRAIDGLMAWWTDLNEGIGVVQQGFNSVRDAVQPVIDKIAAFRDMLANVGDALPDWLTPGSPTPFELGLDGIDRALGDVSQTLPDFRAGLQLDEPMLPGIGGVGGVGAGAGGVIVNLTINVAGTVTAERDLYENARIYLEEWLRTNT
jgi:phage-related minor tail protein